jgi:NodT family efflux transporter outer membrane factor (OMF) lipoprotein
VRFTSEAPVDRWWEVFQDSVLDDLVAQARARNEGLQAAIARVQVARALAREAAAPLLPSISANGAYANEKLSLDELNLPIPEERPFTRTDFYQGTADMSYELDLWGRLRRGLESANAAARASDEDRKSAEITLVAEVVEAYFDVGQAEAALAIAREAVSVRERTIHLLEARRRLGLAQDLDLELAASELEAARADVPEAERQRAVSLHRLAVLTGRPCDLKLEGKPPEAFSVPPEVPVGIPSTLVERRPDVRAAEARLVAATARIGAARANYFPRFTIVGQFGYGALNASQLNSPQAQLWTIGPAVSIPIFQGGLTQAQVFEAEARTGEAAATFKDTVLRAFGEVADAVVGIAARVQTRDRRAAAARRQEHAVVVAESQFRDGLVSYFTVLDAQRTLLARRTALLGAQRELLGELVRLEKALGGGWTRLVEPDTKGREGADDER